MYRAFPRVWVAVVLPEPRHTPGVELSAGAFPKQAPSRRSPAHFSAQAWVPGTCLRVRSQGDLLLSAHLGHLVKCDSTQLSGTVSTAACCNVEEPCCVPCCLTEQEHCLSPPLQKSTVVLLCPTFKGFSAVSVVSCLQTCLLLGMKWPAKGVVPYQICGI